jgi:hypothetical protein
MLGNTIKESTLRQLVKVLLEDKELGPALIKVNPVVDPSAALTDPSNLNYVPDSTVELKVALNSMASEVPQDNVPKIYKSIKQAIEDAAADEKGKPDMKKEKTSVEETVRNIVKKLIEENLVSEALPVPPPRMKLPERLPVPDPEEELKQKGLTAAQKKDLRSKLAHATPAVNPAGVKPTTYAAGASGAKAPETNRFTASPADIRNIASLDKSEDAESEEDNGKKNVTGLASGTFSEFNENVIEKLYGDKFSGESGVKQFIEKLFNPSKKGETVENPYTLTVIEFLKQAKIPGTNAFKFLNPNSTTGQLNLDSLSPTRNLDPTIDGTMNQMQKLYYTRLERPNLTALAFKEKQLAGAMKGKTKADVDPSGIESSIEKAKKKSGDAIKTLIKDDPDGYLSLVSDLVHLFAKDLAKANDVSNKRKLSLSVIDFFKTPQLEVILKSKQFKDWFSKGQKSYEEISSEKEDNSSKKESKIFDNFLQKALNEGTLSQDDIKVLKLNPKMVLELDIFQKYLLEQN